MAEDQNTPGPVDNPAQAQQRMVIGPTAVASAVPLPQASSPVPAAAQADDPYNMAWTASEFIHHDKSAGWYLGLAAGTVLLAAAAFLLTRGILSVVVIMVAGIIMAFYGSHRPRELEYRLDQQGITVGHKTYSYDDFRSFSVMPDGAFSSIVFMPLKRFAVSLSIYFAPQDEEQIVALLSDQLPFEGHQHDAVDSLMRRIRF